ncbi:MAG: M20/M25/M40 family metallo-hydrolase [Oscillibacter sp.]|nr:M20/M25/M40 family metallo-hydrolase [Oscillibacter sp.]
MVWMLFVELVLPLLGILLVLLLIAVIRTLVQGHKTSTYVPAPDPDKETLCAEKLSAMVQCETISVRGVDQPEKFRRFHQVLKELYPVVFNHCEVMDIDGNLLLHWKGVSSSNPIMLMSHMDVVPASGGWSRDPFGGEIADGKVWGRGTADTKASVMAFYQAAEELISEGYVPPVDIYLCSSCTEEVGGDGAPKIVQWLKDHDVKLSLLCDEGGGIISEPIGGVPGYYAMVGVYEKGTGDLKFTARSAGGHASAPARNTPIARLGKFITEVETKTPMKVKFSPEVDAMFSRLAPYASFPLHLVLGNLWLFKPLLKRVLPLISPQAAAMLQTTIAFTMQKGSDGYNVIPQEAYVTANLRFIPHQKVDESVEVLTKLAAKYDIETEVLMANDPSPSLDLKGCAFHLTEAAIAEVFPGLPVSPYIVTGATDCRFYNDVCDNCVRFAPVVYGPEQLKGMHGIDENIETNCLPGAVEYYKAMIRLQGSSC